MKIFYIILAVAAVAVVAAAYWSGGRIGRERCRAEIAEVSNDAAAMCQIKIMETKRIINAETFNTGVADIRNRLRANWTIKD